MNFTPLSQIPDISFYQDANNTLQGVDFVKMRTVCDGVIIRAGQHNWIDEDFATNWKNAKQAGLQRGSYWFYDSRETPEKQALLWKTAIGNDLPEWGLWADLEENYNGAYQGEANWRRFVESTRVYFPHTPIGIYTGVGWWREQIVRLNDYWASFPLWLAQYDNTPTDITMPYPWLTKGAVLLQYTDKGDGLKYGVESLNIDLNYTSRSFYNLFGDTPPVPPDTGGTMDKYMRVTGAASPSLNIRSSGANLGIENDLGQFNLLPNDVIHVVENNTANYQRFDKIYRDNVSVVFPSSPTGQYWAVAISGSTVYLMDIVYTPPVEPPANSDIHLEADLHSDGTITGTWNNV